MGRDATPALAFPYCRLSGGCVAYVRPDYWAYFSVLQLSCYRFNQGMLFTQAVGVAENLLPLFVINPQPAR